VSDREVLPETLASVEELHGPVFDVVRDTIRFPDGAQFDRVVVRHPGAVALIVIDEDDRWLLVRQYRHPAGAELLEVPAGGIEPGEAPEQTAAREVREETGFAAGVLERIGGSWMVPGWGDEFMHYFVARELVPDPLPQDDDERLSDPVRMTIEELHAAVDDGTLVDAKTLVALLLYERHQLAVRA
jgi:ADP-ribose pyrophosphatase